MAESVQRGKWIMAGHIFAAFWLLISDDKINNDFFFFLFFINSKKGWGSFLFSSVRLVLLYFLSLLPFCYSSFSSSPVVIALSPIK